MHAGSGKTIDCYYCTTLAYTLHAAVLCVATQYELYTITKKFTMSIIESCVGYNNTYMSQIQKYILYLSIISAHNIDSAIDQ